MSAKTQGGEFQTTLGDGVRSGRSADQVAGPVPTLNQVLLTVQPYLELAGDHGDWGLAGLNQRRLDGGSEKLGDGAGQIAIHAKNKWRDRAKILSLVSLA